MGGLVQREGGHPVVAACLDLVMAPMAKLRPRVLADARGQVLEIGVGTGMNLPHYHGVDAWCGVEPDPHMVRRARARMDAEGFDGDLRQAGAEALPFEDARFDVVVATWVFCTIPDIEAAAAEVARVLRPGGRLVWIEHVGSTHPPMRTLQRAIDPLWQRLAGGCHLQRDPVRVLEGAGLAVEGVRPVGPERWTLIPQLRGQAVRR